MHTHNFLIKMKFFVQPEILLASFLGGGLITIIETFIFQDWTFLAFLSVLVMLDTALGFLVHWLKGTISSKGFSNLFVKIIIYFSMLILTHVLTHFMVDGQVLRLFSFFDEAVLSAIILRESISIVENVAILNPNLVPSWLVSKLKSFEEKIDPNNDKLK
jgi:phage-related holin